MDSPELSVIICSRDGERTLPATLAHLQKQSLNPSRYEVIVVDDGSRDRTSEVARSHGARVVRLDQSVGLAAARNAGVDAARRPIVAFTDDDCQPAANWLAALAAAFSAPDVDGVGGLVLPVSSDGFVLGYLEARKPLAPLGAELLASSRPIYRLRLYLRGVLSSQPDLPAGAPLYAPIGANMAFRRKLIIELDGFDEAFTLGCDEEELCRRAHSRPQPVHLRYEPAAVVLHRFEPELRDTLRRARAYGRGHGRATLKHRDMRLILYPFPLITAAAIAGALITRRTWPPVLGALAPLAAYARWPIHAWRTRSLAPLAYPYLQLAEEVWTIVGELQGLAAGYTPAPSRWLAREDRGSSDGDAPGHRLSVGGLS
jgi:glycosyltransferase involved in cell wall biosynthesis